MTKELISIIVPVYNVEQYLNQCVESIVNQSYEDIEIILVDDGSTDTSGYICETLKAKDSRIQVVHKSNGGQSEARNVGISYATGNYLFFVDSDDFLPRNSVKTLYLTLKQSSADIACAKRIKYYNQSSLVNQQGEGINIEVWDSSIAIENMLYESKISSSAWAKIYKRELFDDIMFPVGKTYEDLYILYRLFYKCKKIAFSNVIVYYYRIRSNSIIGQLNPKNNKDLLFAAQDILEFVNSKIPSILPAAEYKVFFASIELFVHYPIEKMSQKDLLEMEELWNLIITYRRDVILNAKVKSKYRLMALASYTGKTILRRLYRLIAIR